MELLFNILQLVINWFGIFTLIILGWSIITHKNVPIRLFKGVVKFSTHGVILSFALMLIMLLTFPTVITTKMDVNFNAIFTKQQQDHDDAMKKLTDLTDGLTATIAKMEKRYEIMQAMLLAEREMSE